MRLTRSQRAAALREFILELSGGVCARCRGGERLEFDLKISDGGRHHSLSHSERQRFYLLEFQKGNLQILCRKCHQEKTTADVRDRAARAKLLGKGRMVWEMPVQK